MILRGQSLVCRVLITGSNNLARFLRLYDSVRNGLTLCAGSLGANQQQYIPDLIHRFGNRIHFGHVRNLKHLVKISFMNRPI